MFEPEYPWEVEEMNYDIGETDYTIRDSNGHFLFTTENKEAAYAACNGANALHYIKS